ncbi:ChlI component of cobalt chelatase involved in B12 biosynthesis [Dehalococcoides mccartyi]|uniref:winged helix-turn-helix domain-containing protein n=1 Tax=Dehalococcoides mccartyi TaxID=61435 RepID=UPI002159E7EE|nr:winged helix-turn-helix domain-containing protein [Dehalococcoides mccartyi]MBA2084231.1 ChlI component of cobalt chelatase involved in B12 biosynthesis [Dehalococcoides mccartyi]
MQKQRPVYPFSAIVGQDKMKQALILNAINPGIGGVLLRGEKGTAKSLAVRALSGLLPDIDAVDGCAYGCNPSNPMEQCDYCLDKLQSEHDTRIIKKRVPVIVLSVRSSEADIVRALELGADDYVLKPFHQLELTSRVNAQLRHGEAGEGECLVLGDYSLDLAERVLSVDNQSISLTRIESIVLETLFNRAGHVVSHTTLAEQIWGDTHPSTVRNVRIHIKRLRSKLEKEGGIIYLIQTKPGVGYSVQTKPLAPPNLSILKDVSTDSCHQSFPF